MKYIDHLEHGPWERVAPCVVYCACGARLYQGDVPKTAEHRREIMEAFDAVVQGLKPGLPWASAALRCVDAVILER